MTKVQALNIQLANWSVLYIKLHKFHWYVEGPEFFTLHEKFEEFYNDATDFTDVIAERILTIGDKPWATLQEYLDNSEIKECDKTPAAKEMVQVLVSDYETIIKSSRALIDICEDESDVETADIFCERVAHLEKVLWMLKSYLA